MVIECKTCHARFRLDESKIKGKGVRVRCRKCGEQIMVLNEAASVPQGDAPNQQGAFEESASQASSDNLIRFPKSTSQLVTSPDTEDKKLDLAFEQLFTGTTEEEAPKHDAARTAPAKSPGFEPPTEKLEFGPPAELTFEIQDLPSFPFNAPQNAAAKDEPFDLAALMNIDPDPVAAKEPPQIPSFAKDFDVSSTLETQDAPDFQAKAENPVPPKRFLIDAPQPPAAKDEPFDLTAFMDTDPGPEKQKRHTPAFGKDFDIFGTLETQDAPGFKAKAENPVPPKKFLIDDAQDEAAKDEPFDLTALMDTDPGAEKHKRQTPAFGKDFEIFSTLETQDAPGFQAQAKEPGAPKKFLLGAAQAHGANDELFDLAALTDVDAADADPGAEKQKRQTSAFGKDFDIFSTLETQDAPGFQAQGKEPGAPKKFLFGAAQTKGAKDELFDLAALTDADSDADAPVDFLLDEPQALPDRDGLFDLAALTDVDADPGDATKERQAPPLENDFHKALQTNDLIDFQAQDEEPDTPVEFLLDEPQAEAPKNELFDLASAMNLEEPPPITDNQQAQAATPRDELFDLASAMNLEEPTPITDNQQAKAEAPKDELFDLASAMNLEEPPAITENQQAAQISELTDFQTPIEEPDAPTQFLPGSPQASADNDELFDLAATMNLEAPDVKTTEQQAPSIKQDFLKAPEIKELPDFHARAEKHDMPTKFVFGAPQAPADKGELFDLAATINLEAPDVKTEEQQAPSIKQDFLKTLEIDNLDSKTQAEYLFDDPHAPAAHTDAPSEFLRDALRPAASKDKVFDLAAAMATLATTAKNEEQSAPRLWENEDAPATINAPKPLAPQSGFLFQGTALDAPDVFGAATADDITVKRNEIPRAAPITSFESEQESDSFPEEKFENVSGEPAHMASLPSDDAPAASGFRSARAAGGVILLALLCTTGFFFTEKGKNLAASVSAQLAVLLGNKPSRAASTEPYEIKNVIGYYDSGVASKSIFVIKGQVTNLTQDKKNGYKINAFLLDTDDNILMKQTVYAGNMLTGTRIREESRKALEDALQNPLGDQLINTGVDPGKAVPFIVLFFDAPENISNYDSEAVEK